MLTCSIENCGKPVASRGWCATHYARWRRSGEHTIKPRALPAACDIDGCDLPAKSRGWCEKHYTRWQRHGDPTAITRNPPSTATAVEKQCPRCKKVKAIVQFGVRRNGGPKGYCIECEGKYQRAYVATPRGRERSDLAKAKWQADKSRDYLLQYNYGITAADYDRMLAEQDGKCAICGTTNPGAFGHLCVDHCHNTNAVRGLLCHNCNRGIGFLGDDLERVRSAAAYLERHVPS